MIDSVIYVDNWVEYTDLSNLLALISLDQELTYITLITITGYSCAQFKALCRLYLQHMKLNLAIFATMSGGCLE